jgi:hypothetical protein
MVAIPMNTSSTLLSLGSLLLSLCACGCTSSSQVSASASSNAPAIDNAPPAAAKGEVALRSGESLGPVAVGMRRDAVERLGLAVRPHPSGQMGDNVRMVGPYYVVFTDGKVSSVELTPRENGAFLRVGERVLSPTATIDEVAALLPGCGAREAREGGSVRTCDGGKTLLKMGASCAEREPSGACAKWDPTRPELSVQVLRP